MNFALSRFMNTRPTDVTVIYCFKGATKLYFMHCILCISMVLSLHFLPILFSSLFIFVFRVSVSLAFGCFSILRFEFIVISKDVIIFAKSGVKTNYVLTLLKNVGIVF